MPQHPEEIGDPMSERMLSRPLSRTEAERIRAILEGRDVHPLFGVVLQRHRDRSIATQSADFDNLRRAEVAQIVADAEAMHMRHACYNPKCPCHAARRSGGVSSAR
jgi:hypothetical protein